MRPLHECLFNPKPWHYRHSRAGGNPVKYLIRLDSRLRGNDRTLVFLYKTELNLASCKGLIITFYLLLMAGK